MEERRWVLRGGVYCSGSVGKGGERTWPNIENDAICRVNIQL
jgi:hypothetical protein